MTRIKQLASVAALALLLCPTGGWAALHLAKPDFLGDGSVRVSVEADAPMDVDSLQFNLPDSFSPMSLTETPADLYQTLDQTIAPATVLFFGLRTFHIDKGPLFHWDFKPSDPKVPLAGFEPTYLVGDSEPLPLSAPFVPEPATWVLLLLGSGLVSLARASPHHPRWRSPGDSA